MAAENTIANIREKIREDVKSTQKKRREEEFNKRRNFDAKNTMMLSNKEDWEREIRSNSESAFKATMVPAKI